MSLALLAGELLSAWVHVEFSAAATVAILWIVGALLRWNRTILAFSGLTVVVAAGIYIAGRAAELPRGGCFLPRRGEPVKRWIEAEIEGLPARREDGYRVRAAVRLLDPDREPVCGSVLLTLLGAIGEPPAGARLRMHATLRRARSFANPRGYDYAAALARRGIWVTAHANATTVTEAGDGTARRNRITAARQRIGRSIDDALPRRDAALLRALIIGDQTAVPPDLWDTVAAAGLAHLLSVSGLHIALVWGLVFAAVNWVLSRSERLLLHVHVRAIAAAAALVPAAGYAALAGLGVPVFRAAAMTALFVVCLVVGREARSVAILCATAALIALLRPGAPLDASFQLSFASVLSLMLAGESWSLWRLRNSRGTGRRGMWERVALAWVASAAALAGTTPLVAFHFNRWTPIALVTNPVLVPLAGAPATVLGLVGSALSTVSDGCAQPFFALARWPLELLCAGARWAAACPLGSARVPTPTLLELAIAYGWLGLVWVPPTRRRTAALFLSVAIAADFCGWTYERRLRSDLRVRFLDVGQGDAAVVELPKGKVMVIDGGGFSRTRFDVGERVIAPYLWSRKISRIDFLVATHGDWDHQGGLHYLARAFAARELWISPRSAHRSRLGRLEQEVRRAGGVVRTLAAGDTAWTDGVLEVDCLHPPRDATLSANDSSLVLLVRLRRTSLLFTGDVERPGEALLARHPAPGAVTVIKVPHHGSRTSSGEVLLDWARPRVAVVSVGAGNGYGLPDPSVLRRYARFGARCLRTDRDGSVAVVSSGQRTTVRTRREANAPFCSLLGALC